MVLKCDRNDSNKKMKYIIAFNLANLLGLVFIRTKETIVLSESSWILKAKVSELLKSAV